MTFRFKSVWWPAVLAALTFVSLGWALLPYPGLQNDEVLFSTPDFHLISSSIFDVPVMRWHLPVMLLSYLGALKTWLYAPILTRIRPSYLTVRLPVLLLGAMTTGIFVWFLQKIHSRRAAWVGGVLLATDTTFLLTTCFDWGPVVLQRLLGVSAIVLLWKCGTSGSRRALGCGCFALGLAMWDKALFIWLLLGLAVAAVVVIPKELWSRCDRRSAGLAAAAFCLGALPLLVYNAVSDLATFRSNSSFEWKELPAKYQVLRTTWDGSSLFNFLVNSPGGPGQEREPQTGLERISGRIEAAFGPYGRNRLTLGLAAALLLTPFLWFTRVRKMLLFCLIAFVVGWFQMALTRGAGLSAHHVSLLWPLPHWFLAAAFAEASLWKRLPWRNLGGWLLALAVVYLAAGNLLLTNQCFYQFVRDGAARTWTDAIYPLSDRLDHFRGAELVADDWGILNPLVVLHRGRLPLLLVDDTFLTPGESERQHRYDVSLLEHDVWIGHTAAFQEFAGRNQLMAERAGGAGFDKQIIETVPDRNGRQVFELFRFVRRQAAAGASN